MANSDYFGLANSLSRARRPPAQNDVYLQQPRNGGGGRPPQQFSGGLAMAKPGWGGAPYGGMRQQGFGGGGFGSGLAGVNAVPGGFGNAPPSGGMGSVMGGGFQGRPMDTTGGFQVQPGQFGFANPYGAAGQAPPSGGMTFGGGMFGGNPGTQYMGGMGDALGLGGPQASLPPASGGMPYGGDARPPAFGGGPTPMPGGGGPAFGGGPTMGGNMDPNTSRLARPNVPAFGGGPQPGPQPMMLPPNPYGGPKP